jgi:hypothetical protein
MCSLRNTPNTDDYAPHDPSKARSIARFATRDSKECAFDYASSFTFNGIATALEVSSQLSEVERTLSAIPRNLQHRRLLGRRMDAGLILSALDERLR